MGVKLVALDIDGTILPPGAPPDAEPSPRLKAAVKDLQRSGIVVVLASGRMFPGTAEIARHLGVRAPLICQQGCSVHLLDGAITHLFPIERRAALEICAYAREVDRPYEWFNPCATSPRARPTRPAPTVRSPALSPSTGRTRELRRRAHRSGHHQHHRPRP
jgi:HAD superfamily hydrolase (TIGR01484 family)